MTRRALKAELDGEKMTVVDAVRRLLSRGCKSPDIYLALEKFSTRKSLEFMICQERKKIIGPLTDMDIASRRIFEREAAARGVSAHWIMSNALRILASDITLLENVFDDELPPRKGGR